MGFYDEINEVVFDVEKAYSQHAITNTEVQARYDIAFQAVIVSAMKRFLEEKSSPPLTIQYPADWWQALKKRWFPCWALQRWPVRMHVHTVTASIQYRNPRVDLSQKGRSCSFAFYDHSRDHPDTFGDHVRTNLDHQEHDET